MQFYLHTLCAVMYFQDLGSLIVYCRSKRINPWKWEEQQKASVCEMFSFSESSAISRTKDPKGELMQAYL